MIRPYPVDELYGTKISGLPHVSCVAPTMKTLPIEFVCTSCNELGHLPELAKKFVVAIR